jgi:alpha 1,2-mannosyltransferase
MKPDCSLSNEEQVESMRFEIAAGTDHPLPNTLEGRGIVMCAGGEKYLPSAWISVNQLRNLGCILQIEMWHFSGEIVDPWPRFFEQLGVCLVDASKRLSQQAMMPAGGWELKCFAIVFSAFHEVLLLDADNLAVEDPTHLFNEPAYLTEGAVFWEDSHSMIKDERIWEICRIARRNEREFESGQLLVDKRRCWQELMLALYMNEHSRFFYRYLYGDKDTFRFAWHKRNRTFAIPSAAVQNPLTGSMFQPGLHGHRLFQHRTWYKWELGENRREPDFWFDSECRRWIEELRCKLGRSPQPRESLRMRRRVRS